MVELWICYILVFHVTKKNIRYVSRWIVQIMFFIPLKVHFHQTSKMYFKSHEWEVMNALLLFVRFKVHFWRWCTSFTKLAFSTFWSSVLTFVTWICTAILGPILMLPSRLIWRRVCQNLHHPLDVPMVIRSRKFGIC